MENDPLWYKDAILYELHVRAFYDSTGDGIGDFRGLVEKLDYLQDLGITTIWLLPFYPSPLRDDGYDIADYTNVHPAYGTLHDVKLLVREVHRRGLKLVTELVCNHTSDQHPWFQRARRAKAGSTWRNFYVWSDTPEKYKEARIIFKDFETSNWAWDPVAGAYYWHRFYSHQPDLNYDNPRVREAIFKVMDFWLQMGIDGLRLDAIPYLYEREGTNCENLPETHAFLKELRRHIDERFPNRMLLAEANQWPEDAVAYFGDGDECHMAFHFPLMPRMFMAIYMEDRFPIVDILTQTPPIPDNAQWALFLRNHDELTLEMVTDEERDYMYRVYASDPRMRINLGIRRRLAPLLGNDRRRIELMNGLLFSLPGTPVIYYGDEIGMGDNVYLGDRNGVRTPMQWSADRNAGFSVARRQQLYLPVIVDAEYHYEAINVEAQQRNRHSLLWWMKRLIALRKRHKAFGRGKLEFLYPENRKVLAFVRRYEARPDEGRDECILVVANLSRFVQPVELDLAAFKGLVPVELFGGGEFPPVSNSPYFLTLGPHAFYWFSLEPQRSGVERLTLNVQPSTLNTVTLAGTWEGLWQGKNWAALADILSDYLQLQPWFRGRGRRIKSTEVREAIPVPNGRNGAYITLIQINYAQGDTETYVETLAYATGDKVNQLFQDLPQTIIARLQFKSEEGLLYAALADQVFSHALLEAIAGHRRLKGTKGDLIHTTTRSFRRIYDAGSVSLEPCVVKSEQYNTLVIYGNRLILKIFRQIEEGINPDLEIERFLTERDFAHIPPLAGALEYHPAQGEPLTLAILREYVPNARTAWQYTLDTLGHYFERAAASHAEAPPEPAIWWPLQDPPTLAAEMIGAYLEAVRLLGQRTAELHLALASDPEDPCFAPEPLTGFYQRSIYQSMHTLASQVLQTLRKRLRELPDPVQAEAQQVLEHEEKINQYLRSVLEHKITAERTRYHGNYHLERVLFTGKDFIIVDFEGDPGRPMSERRLKRSPLRDVASMLSSFHYASHAALFGLIAGVTVRPEDFAALRRWTRFWCRWVSTTFVKAYLQRAGQARFLPRTEEEIRVLLDTFLLDRALYELRHELDHRLDWVRIPLQGILQLLESGASKSLS